MTVKEMEGILSLAETLNFSESAYKMNITQPAFSRMIQRAEEELGFSLFIRNTRGVTVSREGEPFIAALRQSLAIYNSGIKLSTSIINDTSTLNIDLAAEFICYDILPGIEAFKRENPDVNIECHPITMDLVTGNLRSRTTDLAIIFSDKTKFDPLFSFKLLKKVPLHVVVNVNSPLAKKEILRPEDLTTENFIILKTSVFSYEIGEYGAPLNIVNEKFNLNIRESLVASSTQASMLEVATGHGICFITSELGRLLPANCVLKPFDGVDFYLTALWNNNFPSKWIQPMIRSMINNMTDF